MTEAMSKEKLKKELLQLVEEEDYQKIHNFLCHPWTKECSNHCNRTVDPYRLALYGEVCNERTSY
jgi:hypothetical protein